MAHLSEFTFGLILPPVETDAQNKQSGENVYKSLLKTSLKKARAKEIEEDMMKTAGNVVRRENRRGDFKVCLDNEQPEEYNRNKEA